MNSEVAVAKDQKARQKILAERTLHRNFLTQHFEILTAIKRAILFPKSILSSAFGSGISAAGGGAMELWIGGGISGGLGSMIAGGNFVDGLRQVGISFGYCRSHGFDGCNISDISVYN